VPVIIVNYDGFYDCLLEFIKTMEGHGTVGVGEYDQMVVKKTNEVERCRLTLSNPP
jgi:hypothetical protein